MPILARCVPVLHSSIAPTLARLYTEATRPLGDNPWRIRGYAYQDLAAYCEGLGGGSYDSLLAEMTVPLRDFLTQTFHTREWYDVYPLALFGSHLARRIDRAFAETVWLIGHLACDKDFAGPLRHVLKLMSPRLIATFLPRIADFYWQQFRVYPKAVGPNAVEIRAANAPRSLGYYATILGSAYNVRSLELKGAQKVECEIAGFSPTATINGIAVGDIVYRIRWTAA